MKGDEKMSEFYGREQFKKGYPNLYKQLKNEVRQETLKEINNKINAFTCETCRRIWIDFKIKELSKK